MISVSIVVSNDLITKTRSSGGICRYLNPLLILNFMEIHVFALVFTTQITFGRSISTIGVIMARVL